MRSYYISKSYILSVLLTLETRKHEQMLQMYINVRLASSPKSHLSEIYIRLSLLQDLWGIEKYVSSRLLKLCYLLWFRARSCMLREPLNGVLRMHLFLSSPENSCRPISAMTARKNKNKTKTSLKSFKERSKVFTIARRPEKGNENLIK